jgi:hypothetical protein
VFGGCGDGLALPAVPNPVSDIGVQHIHGLGINPADRSRVIATYTGLFRV